MDDKYCSTCEKFVMATPYDFENGLVCSWICAKCRTIYDIVYSSNTRETKA